MLNRLLIAATLCMLALMCVAAGSAYAVSEGPETLSVAPARTIYTVEPGGTYDAQVVFRNLTRDSFTAYVEARSLVTPDDTRSFAVLAKGEPSGAARWFAPGITSKQVTPDQQVDIPVTIEVPEDARPGVHPVGVYVYRVMSDPSSTTEEGARVTVAAGAVSQFVLTVPGDLETKAHLERLSSPRVLWPGETGRFSAVLENDGDTLLDAKSVIAIGAFTGRAEERIPLPDVDVLPGGRRELAVRWKDRPLFGWFEPLVAVEANGERIERSYPVVFVLPPWWVVALLVAAILLPIVLRLRRRRRDRHDDAG